MTVAFPKSGRNRRPAADVTHAWASSNEQAQAKAGWGIRISKVLAPLLMGPLAIYRPIRADTVARALVNLGERSETGVFIHHHDELEAAA